MIEAVKARRHGRRNGANRFHNNGARFIIFTGILGNNPGDSFIKYIFPDQDPAPVEDRSVDDAQSKVTTGQADDSYYGPSTDQTTVASNDSGGEDELPA